MAEGFVKFFLQRLNSLLLCETKTFSGVEQQTERIVSTLREIGDSSGDVWGIKGDAAVSSWINELRDVIFDVDNLIDEFIIQMDWQDGSDDNRSELTQRFTGELQAIESRLARSVEQMTQLKSSTSTSIGGDMEDRNRAATREEKLEEKANESPKTEEGQISSSSSSLSIASPSLLNRTDLPYYLQHCLKYCCVFPENYWVSKGKLVRLLVAEGLVQDKAGKLMEDVAEENINSLINLGMLQVKDEPRGKGTTLTVPSPYRRQMEEDNLIGHYSDSNIPRTGRHVAIYSDMETAAPLLSNIQPRSLLFLGGQDLSGNRGNWLDFDWAKYLQVLDLERTKIDRLPNGVGDLILLTYLGLKHTDLRELPARLGNLRALQTLDIRWCGDITALPVEILDLVRLRHIKMFKNRHIGGVKLPPGIKRLSNILTLTGIHAGDGIAQELRNLIHLRRLGVMDVAEENFVELFASIMMMQNLLSLSLEARHSFNRGMLVLSNTFSPPPLLRKLRLEGILQKLPDWIGTMENLTSLRLGFSRLSENPASVLQLLPNLKTLTLWHAYEAKQLGKEFCSTCGFPKLEVLIIVSHVLEEWTELEEGALPSLQYLQLHNCLKLRMLPEGLQFVTTLKQLHILPLLDEHEERLKPDGGEENYKIRHIPRISYIPMSVLRNSSQLPSCNRQEEGDQQG